MHRKNAVSGALAALSLLVVPCAQAQTIGTPQDLGNANTTASQATVTISTTGKGDCPAGSFVGVIGLTPFGRTLSSVMDGAGNTYTLQNNVNNSVASVDYGFATSITTHDLPDGSTITATFSVSNSNTKMAAAFCVSGIASAATDILGSGNASTVTAVSYPSSGTLTPSQTPELLIATVAYNNSTPVTISPWTDGNGHAFNSISSISSAPGGYNIHWGYVIENSTAGVQQIGTLSASRNWLANLYSFKGGSPPPPPPTGNHSGLLLMGVGE